jgi:hypothetical protein
MNGFSYLGGAISHRQFMFGMFYYPPIDFLNRALVRDTISQSQCCASLLRRLRCRAKGSQPWRQVWRFVREIESRRKRDKAAEKNERSCRVASSVCHEV